MRTQLLRFFILGVILLFLGCATLGSLTQYGEFVVDYPDGDTLVYVLPPEFPELNEDDMEFYPISMFIWIARVEIDGNVYAIFLDGMEAQGLGCGMLLQDKEDYGQYWLYDAGGIPQPCTEDEMNDILMQWQPIDVEPESEADSI